MKRLIRAVAALAVIVGLVVGVPLGLLRVGQWSAFGRVDWAHLLTTPDNGALLMGLLTLVGWLAWALFALSLLLEFVAVLSRGRVRVRLPGMAWSQPVAAALVVAVLGGAGQMSPAFAGAPEAAPPVSASAPHQVRVPSHARPADAAPAEASSPAAQTMVTHRVVSGDDLWSIAEQHYGDGTRWRAIAAENHLDPEAVLLPGLVLRLPGLASAVDESQVVVQPGDTLSELAADHLGEADRWPEIADENRALVDDPDLIQPGWVLQLPDQAEANQSIPKDSERPAAPPDAGDAAAGRSTSPTTSPSDDTRSGGSSSASPSTAPVATPDPAPTASTGATAASSSAPASAPVSAPASASVAAPDETLSESAPDGDRLDELGTLTGLLALALVAALAARRRGQLAVRPIGRRIVHPSDDALRFEATMARHATGVREQDELWTAGTVLVGLGADDQPVLLDLERARTTVITGPDELCTAAMASALTSLACASWSADAELFLSGDELEWVAQLDRPQLSAVGSLEEGVVELERRAGARRVALGHASLAELREEPAVAEAWNTQVHLFTSEPTPQQWQRINRALRADGLPEGGLGVCVLAVAAADRLPRCGEIVEVGEERGRLCSSGEAFTPQLIERPARRALMDLFETTASEQTVPAPWWSSDDDLPPNLCVLEPPSFRPAEEDALNDESYPHPTLLLLGPVVLAGAQGPEPNRARHQCAEYCAWIHHNPGRTAVAMNRDLMVADSTRRSNLSRLRGWLGTDPNGEPYLPEAYTGRIALHPGVSTDFEHLQLLVSSGVNRASTDALVDALRLVRGAPLADAAPGSWHWAEELRTDMVSTIRDIGVVLSRRALDAGDHDLARWAASRALKAAPEDELLMVERVRTEHLAGNTREVERLVLHLTRSARILGVDLADDTVETLQEVMEGRRRARYA